MTATRSITRHHPLSLANATWGGFFFHDIRDPATPAAVATVSGVTGAAAVGQQEGIKTQNIIQVDYLANEIAI